MTSAVFSTAPGRHRRRDARLQGQHLRPVFPDGGVVTAQRAYPAPGDAPWSLPRPSSPTPRGRRSPRPTADRCTCLAARRTWSGSSSARPPPIPRTIQGPYRSGRGPLRLPQEERGGRHPSRARSEFEAVVLLARRSRTRRASRWARRMDQPGSLQTVDLQGHGKREEVQQVLRQPGIDPDGGPHNRASRVPGLRRRCSGPSSGGFLTLAGSAGGSRIGRPEPKACQAGPRTALIGPAREPRGESGRGGGLPSSRSRCPAPAAARRARANSTGKPVPAGPTGSAMSSTPASSSIRRRSMCWRLAGRRPEHAAA